MQSQPHELRIYETGEGEAPFVTWLDNLRDRKARANIRKRLDRVMLGNFGDFKSVGQGILELRIDYGPGYRVYFALTGTLVVLLLCGGDKSTQKQDIQKAQEFWEDFKRRDITS